MAEGRSGCQSGINGPARRSAWDRANLSSGASERFPSGNRKISNFSGYKTASSTRNPRKFTEITDPKQGEYARQQGKKSTVLATFFMQIARFSRESEFFPRKSG